MDNITGFTMTTGAEETKPMVKFYCVCAILFK